jgi:hypothetical protein
MNNFSKHQEQEIENTSTKLAELSNHLAHPFLIKTFDEVLAQYHLLKTFEPDQHTMQPEVFWIQRSFMLNMLAALNLRIDTILRERNS